MRNTLTLAEILTDQYAPLRRLRPQTVSLYEITLRHFDRYLATVPGRARGRARLADLDDLVVAKFVAFREAERCPATAKKDRVQLLALWRYCARKRMVREFPELPPMRVPDKVPRAYTKADLEALLEHFAGITGTVADVPASSWWSSLVRTLFETGCRIGETLSVEWPDVNLATRTITIRAENRKGRTRDIVREITPQTAELLAARWRSSGRVWPWAMNGNYVFYVFRQHCERAGVTYRRGFHAIRKASCSYAAAAGADATALADHADAATTRRHYLDPSIVKGESNLARLPRLGADDQADDDELEERALLSGFQAGSALAASGARRPDRSTASALATVAGHAGHAALFARGIALGWSQHHEVGDQVATRDSAAEIGGRL